MLSIKNKEKLNKEESLKYLKYNNKRIKQNIFFYDDFKYEGEMKNGRPDGKGIMIYSNGNIYKGEFKKGRPDGKGIMTYSNGNKYEGEWKKGFRKGKGIYYYLNDNIYDGNWKNGKPNGNGVLNKNGFEYNGIWSSENENVKCNGVVKNKNKEIIFEGKFKINE